MLMLKVIRGIGSLKLFGSNPKSYYNYSRLIINITGKSRDQNLRVAMYKCLISYTLQTQVILMPFHEEQITSFKILFIYVCSVTL